MTPSFLVSMPSRSTVPAEKCAVDLAGGEVDDGDVVVLLQRDDGLVLGR